MSEPLNVFVSYGHRDEESRELFHSILKPVVREGTIDAWHDVFVGTSRRSHRGASRLNGVKTRGQGDGS